MYCGLKGNCLYGGAGPAKRNLDMLARIGKALVLVGVPLVLFGDFNMTPQQLADTGRLATIQDVAKFIQGDSAITCTSDKGSDARQSMRSTLVKMVRLGRASPKLMLNSPWPLRCYGPE